MKLYDMVQAFSKVQDTTTLGAIIKYPDKIEPKNDDEFNAKSYWMEFLKTFFNDKHSSYIQAETIKDILLKKNCQFYDDDKLERTAEFIRTKMKPAQILTDEWIVYFVHRFK